MEVQVFEVMETSPYAALAVLLLSMAVRVLRGEVMLRIGRIRPNLDDPDDLAIIAIAAGLKRSPKEVADAFRLGWELLHPQRNEKQ